jgi:ribosomal protein S18 acetylase RimI-like enzyme
LHFYGSKGAIGALHVLPEWRRLGLAQVVVDNLCVKQAQAFVNLPIKHQIYLQAIAENFNTASKNMFKKLGWSKSDIGVTWIRCQAKSN